MKNLIKAFEDMKRSFSTSFIRILGAIGIAIGLQGCVTIFKSTVQKDVELKTEEEDRDPKITVMNKPDTGVGSLSVDLKRKTNAFQAVLMEDGYKDAYRAVYSDRLGAGVIIGLILDIPVPVMLFIDGISFRKFQDYEDPYLMAAPQVKIPERTSSEKYLYHSSTSFDIAKNDTLIVRYGSPEDRKEGKSPKAIEYSSERLEVENFLFNSDINDLLVRLGYRDTTKEEEGLSLNDYNSVQLKSTIEDLKIVKYSMQQSYFTVRLKVNWELMNNFGETLYDTSITTRSGQFARDLTAYDFYERGDSRREMTENLKNAKQKRFRIATLDAMETSLIRLVQGPEVDKIMKKGTEKEERKALEDLEPIRIPKPSLSSKKGMNQEMEGVVTIDREEGHGSGCILSKDGYILTNYHVVAGSDTLDILFDPDTEKEGVLKRKSKTMDLALLKVDTSGLNPLRVRQNEKLNIGSDVMAIGTPKSVQLGKSVSKGIVSGKRKLNEVKYIQTDVSINPGNSGGPLIDKSSGEMIGVVTAKMFGVGVEGIGFALPAQEALKKLKIEYE